jgi:hypothetical protein
MRVVDALYELMPGYPQPGGRDNPFIKPTSKRRDTGRRQGVAGADAV